MWTGALIITEFKWGNRRFRLENQMINAFPFGNLRKIWAVMWGGVFFLLVSIYLVVLATLCSGFLTHKVMFNCQMLRREIKWLVFVSHQPLLWWPVCERHTRSTSIKIIRSSFILKNLKQVSCKGGIGEGGRGGRIGSWTLRLLDLLPSAVVFVSFYLFVFGGTFLLLLKKKKK